jgi:hypothetical protein
MFDERHSTEGQPDRRRLQFSIRSLFVLTFVVALFCSAATTFSGASRLLAIMVLAWATAGAIFWRLHAAKEVLLTHGSGPLLGAIFCGLVIWSENFWCDAMATCPGVLAIYLFATTAVSVAYAMLCWLRRR